MSCRQRQTHAHTHGDPSCPLLFPVRRCIVAAEIVHPRLHMHSWHVVGSRGRSEVEDYAFDRIYTLGSAAS